MNNFEKNASAKLDQIAQDISQNEGVNYTQALKRAMQRNAQLAHEYNFGTPGGNVRTYQLTPIERELLLLRADAARVRELAGAIIDHHAQVIAGQVGQGGQVNPDTYVAAVRRISDAYPSLSRASESGFIASDDYWLLGVLIPALAGEIEKTHGVECRVRYQERGTELRKFDDSGREFRRYTIDVR